MADIDSTIVLKIEHDQYTPASLRSVVEERLVAEFGTGWEVHLERYIPLVEVHWQTTLSWSIGSVLQSETEEEQIKEWTEWFHANIIGSNYCKVEASCRTDPD